MVTRINQSSKPHVPPQQGRRAKILSITATNAIPPAIIPVYETSLELSRIGAPKAVSVKFFVAVIGQCCERRDLRAKQNVLSASRIVQSC